MTPGQFPALHDRFHIVQEHVRIIQDQSPVAHDPLRGINDLFPSMHDRFQVIQDRLRAIPDRITYRT